MLEGTSLCFYRCDDFARVRAIGLPLMLAASSPRDILVMNFGCAHSQRRQLPIEVHYQQAWLRLHGSVGCRVQTFLH